MSDFSLLYPTVRTFLGDINPSYPAYSDAQLDLGIGASLLQDGDFSEGDLNVSGGRTIAPDATAKTDQLRLSARAAINLLSPNSGALSWGTRSMRVSRGNNWQAHLGYLQGLLRQAEGGNFAVASETEWDQFIRGTSDTIAKLSQFPG